MNTFGSSSTNACFVSSKGYANTGLDGANGGAVKIVNGYNGGLKPPQPPVENCAPAQATLQLQLLHSTVRTTTMHMVSMTSTLTLSRSLAVLRACTTTTTTSTPIAQRDP